MRGSPASQEPRTQPPSQDSPLLSGPTQGIAHFVPPDPGATDNNTAHYTHQCSFTGSESAALSTSIFPTGLDQSNPYAQTSPLSTPNSVPMQHYFPRHTGYQSLLPDPSQGISAHRLEDFQSTSRPRVETFGESMNVHGSTQVLEGCGWYWYGRALLSSINTQARSKQQNRQGMNHCHRGPREVISKVVASPTPVKLSQLVRTWIAFVRVKPAMKICAVYFPYECSK